MMPAPKPIAVKGTRYPSYRAAARAYGVSESAIRGAVHRGSVDRIGVGPSGANACPVLHNGVVYPSIKEASDKIGVSAPTITRHLEEYGHLNFIGPVVSQQVLA